MFLCFCTLKSFSFGLRDGSCVCAIFTKFEPSPTLFHLFFPSLSPVPSHPSYFPCSFTSIFCFLFLVPYLPMFAPFLVSCCTSPFVSLFPLSSVFLISYVSTFVFTSVLIHLRLSLPLLHVLFFSHLSFISPATAIFFYFFFASSSLASSAFLSFSSTAIFFPFFI